MSKTERLYYADSHLTVFDATVIDVTDRVSGWSGVTLNRSAFYPTGGGQPSDVGFLNSAKVVECIDQEENGILHIVEGTAPRIGDRVTGQVDWSVRLDHLQQHTGQHILSQAFVSLYGAETNGFRMMKEASEIDIELENPSDSRIQAAVDLANEIIWGDRELRIHVVTPDEAARMPLRKESGRSGMLRVIEIDNFDLTPCGGTHAQRSGEVGIITVRSWERAKGLTRVVFLAGGRVLADYNRANATARTVASMFSAARDEAPNLVGKAIEEIKQLTRRNSALETIAARVEADDLISSALTVENVRIISQIFDNKDVEALKRLAHALSTRDRTVALLGSTDAETARLVFARSADAPGDMNVLLKAACVTLEGRGGGKPDLAQGGGPKVERVQEALNNAFETIKLQLRKTD
jgi:alanyl-tRNA synthetase